MIVIAVFGAFCYLIFERWCEHREAMAALNNATKPTWEEERKERAK